MPTFSTDQFNQTDTASSRNNLELHKNGQPQKPRTVKPVKVATLKKNGDFRALYHRGKSNINPCLVTYTRPNRDKKTVCRVGITASAKLGNAVERNRCRRIIKEAYRLLLPEIKGKWDIVLVARKKTLYVKSTKIYNVMREQFSLMGLIPGSSSIGSASTSASCAKKDNKSPSQKGGEQV